MQVRLASDLNNQTLPCGWEFSRGGGDWQRTDPPSIHSQSTSGTPPVLARRTLQPYGDDDIPVQRRFGRRSQLIHFTTLPPSPTPPPPPHHRHIPTAAMDQLQISPETQQGLQNLSAKDKQELNQFVVGETQKAQIQSSTSALILHPML